jgi:two-component system, NtrC family, sensor histidine kinase PilS
MAESPEQPTWFAPAPTQSDHPPPQSAAKDKGPNEFVRLWRGLMTARVTLGLMLLLLQSSLWALGQSNQLWLLYICGGYLAIAIAVRFYAPPRQLNRHFLASWFFTIGVDVAVFSALQILQGGNINYAPLLALPVLLASVLGSLFLAMGTAAAASLILLGHSTWLALYAFGEPTPHFVQSALTGAGLFVIAFLANQLSTRLAQEEERSRLSQRAVQVQRQVNELVIESLTDGILVVDAKGFVRAANPAARQLLGSERALHEATFKLTSEAAWTELAELAGKSFVKVDLRRSDLTIHHTGQGLRRLRVRTRMTTRHAPEDESLCVMFLQDQREMEARTRTDKLASMGRMSAAVAHEIRNPLAAIAQANALLDEDIADPKLKQLTQMIAQNANRLGKIVEEVLNIAHVQSRDSATSTLSVALLEATERIGRDWAAQTRSTEKLVVNQGTTEAQVAFEPEHLRRVLINLLDNALRYASGQAGSIQLGTTQIVGMNVGVNGGANVGGGATMNAQAALFVWSDGPPLEPSVERHLFEPFFSSESRSSGLGLYICRELCDGHGATIIYRRNERSMPGGQRAGNEFFISFRTARAGDSAQTAAAAVAATI